MTVREFNEKFGVGDTIQLEDGKYIDIVDMKENSNLFLGVETDNNDRSGLYSKELNKWKKV